MIFHLGTDLPEKPSVELNPATPSLTPEELRILKQQIRRNAVMIDNYIDRLDLLVNKERYPHRAFFLERLRKRLDLLMEENDTFRSVLWKHFQQMELFESSKLNR